MNRRRVLTAILLFLLALGVVVLFEVIGTVFFAVTVAYLLSPLYRRLVARGVPEWWAAAVSTAVALVSVVVVLAPFGVVLYMRRTDIVAALRSLPETMDVGVMGYTYTVHAGDVTDAAASVLSNLVVGVASQVPILALKLTLFVIVVFALLLRRKEAGAAVLAATPREYHDAVAAFNERTRSTLFSIYVIQAVTALATFVVAAVVFYLLGYRFYFALGIMAGLLQFLPVVGPSLLIAVLVVWEVAMGSVARAVLVGVVGAIVIAWLPDAALRPRLARHTSRLSGSLYFIGFTGGLLSLGPVGIVAGPLVVALIVEASELVASEGRT